MSDYAERPVDGSAARMARATGQPINPDFVSAAEYDHARAALDAARAEAREAEETCRQLAKRSAAHKREADTLREYWEASQAVQGGIVDFDLHHDAVTRLEKATEAVRKALAGRETP